MNAVITPTHTDWIQTYTGRQFWPLEPRVEDIDIMDIAHALSNLCRYGGHVEKFYSVAQHSVLVSHAVPRQYRLRGLLHDAAEAYLIDVPRPIKYLQGMDAYREAEKRLQAVIYGHFGLSAEDPECIKTADNQLLRTEQRDLMKPAPAEWKDYRVGALPETIEAWTPERSKLAFVVNYLEITDPDLESHVVQA